MPLSALLWPCSQQSLPCSLSVCTWTNIIGYHDNLRAPRCLWYSAPPAGSTQDIYFSLFSALPLNASCRCMAEGSGSLGLQAWTGEHWGWLSQRRIYSSPYYDLRGRSFSVINYDQITMWVGVLEQNIINWMSSTISTITKWAVPLPHVSELFFLIFNGHCLKHKSTNRISDRLFS